MNTNPDYEPKRDLWPAYEPWMRDLLTATTRVSWLGNYTDNRTEWRFRLHADDQIHAAVDLRIHPEDCPDKPADPVEELAKVLSATFEGTVDPGDVDDRWTSWSMGGQDRWRRVAEAARNHVAGEWS